MNKVLTTYLDGYVNDFPMVPNEAVAYQLNVSEEDIADSVFVQIDGADYYRFSKDEWVLDEYDAIQDMNKVVFADIYQKHRCDSMHLYTAERTETIFFLEKYLQDFGSAIILKTIGIEITDSDSTEYIGKHYLRIRDSKNHFKYVVFDLVK